MAELVIIRGAPGSGKTTHALSHYSRHVLVEADMYRFVGGKYVFDASKNREAHDWCFKRVCDLLDAGFDVAVANTFTKLWEMERYLVAKPDAKIVECFGDYENSHGVPSEIVQRMRDQFEPKETTE